jgi:DNA-binding LytR/AlgR family response regulator
MPKPIAILIVEDEVLIAQDLKEILQEVGYDEIHKARNYRQAVELINTHHFDLILLDINLNDSNSGNIHSGNIHSGNIHSGIDVANYLNLNFQIPFIFITSYSDARSISDVKQTRPSGFLLKPYNKDLLLASIEIALFNYSIKKNAAEQPLENVALMEEENDLVINNHLLIKDNYRFIKIALKDILWFESDNNYVKIKTLQKSFLIRCSLKRLLNQLPINDFVKCHKQFIINIFRVDSFKSSEVKIQGVVIPISRNVQDEVLRLLKQ